MMAASGAYVAGRPPQLTSRARKTYRDDHGTPPWVLDLHRDMHGPIALDLASNYEANELVRAKGFYALEDPCPDNPVVWSHESIWCNPPGPGSEVKRFWDIWCGCIERGARGSFLAFSVDHIRGFKPPPVCCWVGLLRKRLRFEGNDAGASFPSAIISTSPPDTRKALDSCVWFQWTGALYA